MKKHHCVVLKRVYISSAWNRQDEKSTLRGAIYVDEITRHHRTQIHCNYKELLRKRDTSFRTIARAVAARLEGGKFCHNNSNSNRKSVQSPSKII
jgi:hypothetical protein